MKIEFIKPVLARLKPLTNFFKKDYVGISLIIVAAVFGFLIWRIGQFAGVEPTQADYDEKLLTVVKPKIDQDSIKVIESLQAQNIDIKSYFSDRSNPFQE